MVGRRKGDEWGNVSKTKRAGLILKSPSNIDGGRNRWSDRKWDTGDTN